MKTSVWKVFAIALLVRLVFIVFGDWLDRKGGGLQYTDIDYHVFSDAADLVRNGLSPYERATYRYPPLLALILVPNSYLSSYGKILFSIADAAIIFELRNLLLIVDPQHADLYCWLWAFNFPAINICTRGSSDSITNYLVLLSLRLVLSVRTSRHIPLVGLVVGLLVYIRVYPVIYLPAYAFYIATTCIGTHEGIGKAKNILSNYLNALGNILLLTSCTALTLCTLTYISYYYYGHDYLENAVLYHLSREDHRHNFSMHFYGIYLSKAGATSYAQHLVHQLTQYLPPTDQTQGSTSHICEIGWALVNLVVSILPSVLLFLPQVILFCAIIVTFASHNLPLCLLLQTMVFVSYNKVITAQYFSWYMCLLPVCMRSIRCIPMFPMLVVSAVWCCALAIWLYTAYLLEFLGLNHFYGVWIASVLFHMANTLVIGITVWYAPK